MNYQDKVKDQQPSAFFADGIGVASADRRHRGGGDARGERLLGHRQMGRDALGRRHSRCTTRATADAPLAVDDADMARGRERYKISCAVCHGAAGDGQGHHLQVRPQRRGELP